MIYEFSPKQDLHGYDKPWAAGAGVNIFDDELEFGILNTTTGEEVESSTRLRSTNYIPMTGGERYFINTDYGDGCCYDADKNYIGVIPYSNGPMAGTYYIDPPENTSYFRFALPVSYGTVNKHSICINFPSTITTYSPYSNICPPEGYDIWNPVQDKMVQVYSGYVNANTRELYLRPVYQEYAGEELVGPWMSSMDEYSEDATPTEGAFVIDFGGELESFEITPFMLQTLLDSLGIRQHFTDGAGLLNKLMDQAQGRVRSEAELLNRSFPIHVIAIGKELPTNLVITKPVSDVLPGLPGKTKI